MMTLQRQTPLFLLALTTCFGWTQLNSAQATELQITIENLQPSDGFFFTPVWVGLHDGSFDLFDMGSAASSELETIAEEGDPGPLGALFLSATNGDDTMRQGNVITSPGGFAGAPVFDPGESVTTQWMVDMPASNRFFSFASMVIPSNDAFIGNDNPMAFEVFDSAGNFTGPITIDIMGDHVYDSGTELNNAMGAAFSALGGTDTQDASMIDRHQGLDNFLGTDTAAGTTVNSALGAGVPLARIHISAVPEPSSLVLMALGAVPFLKGRRQRM